MLYGSPNLVTPMLDLLFNNVPVWYEDTKGRMRFAETCSPDEVPIRDDDETYETVPALVLWVSGKPVDSRREYDLKRVFVDYKDPGNPPPKEVLAEG